MKASETHDAGRKLFSERSDLSDMMVSNRNVDIPSNEPRAECSQIHVVEFVGSYCVDYRLDIMQRIATRSLQSGCARSYHLLFISPTKVNQYAHRLPVTARTLHQSSINRDVPQWPNPPVPQPTVTPYDAGSGSNRSSGDDRKGSVYAELASSPIIQAAVTTAIGLIAVLVPARRRHYRSS